MMARMVRVLAVVVGVLLLAGCVPTKPIPEPGFTDAERAAWYDAVEDLHWSSLDLPDDERPVIERRIVDAEEFEALWPQMHATYARMFRGIPEGERKAFVSTLQKMLINIRKHEI